MAPMKRSSVVPGGGGAGPSKRRKSAPRFSESAGDPSKRELEAMVTQLQAENKELKAEKEELKGQLSVVKHNIDTNRTRSEPVGGDQYKVKILGTIGDRVYTGSDVVGQDKKLLKAVLYYNDKKVTRDPFASAKFEILVVRSDFCANDHENWSAEEFERNLVKARKEVGVILTGVCRSKFSNGEKELYGLKFRDNSSWADGKKWRLGVRVLGSYNVRILEYISEPFRVLDRHGKGSEKPHPPSLTSGVECLEKVGHKRALKLKEYKIDTVGDFLEWYHKKQNELLKILSIKSDSDESWIAMIRHAKECDVVLNAYNYIGISTDDDTSHSGQADVQDVNTNCIDSDASTANMDQPHTETDADQNSEFDLSTIQHDNLIQGTSIFDNASQSEQTADVQNMQLVCGYSSMILSDSDDWSQHPFITATVHYQAISAEQIAHKMKELNEVIDQSAGVLDIQQVNADTFLPDSDVQLPDTEADANHVRPDYNLDETSIQEMEQEGSFSAMYYHTPDHENLSDIMETCNDNGSLDEILWSRDALINATIHNSYSRPDSTAEDDQWIEEIIVGNTLLSSLKGGIAAVCFLMRVMRRRCSV